MGMIKKNTLIAKLYGIFTVFRKKKIEKSIKNFCWGNDLAESYRRFPSEQIFYGNIPLLLSFVWLIEIIVVISGLLLFRHSRGHYCSTLIQRNMM